MSDVVVRLDHHGVSGNDDEILGNLFRRFFWNPPNIVEVHTRMTDGTEPYIYVQGRVPLTSDEEALLKRLHAERNQDGPDHG